MISDESYNVRLSKCFRRKFFGVCVFFQFCYEIFFNSVMEENLLRSGRFLESFLISKVNKFNFNK